MSEVHPCDFAASPVSKNILVLSQPTGLSPAPPDVHSVLLASKAKFKCWVPKQVSMKVYFPLLRSSIASWRLLCASGRSLADGWAEPLRQKAGFARLRTDAPSHTLASCSATEQWVLHPVSPIR